MDGLPWFWFEIRLGTIGLVCCVAGARPSIWACQV
jgi:hypothetical protein